MAATADPLPEAARARPFGTGSRKHNDDDDGDEDEESSSGHMRHERAVSVELQKTVLYNFSRVCLHAVMVDFLN